MAINQDEMLIAAGHYQAGLDHLSDLDAHHVDQMSAYGKMWVKEALWDRYVTGAPRPRTPSEQQYSDRKLRSRR